MSTNQTDITDRVTAARKRYDASIVAIQAQTAAPLTEKDMQDARDIAELRSQQRQRFDAARAESLRPKDLPSEKF
jgi:hypothetical protein